jgi:AcrR family transcriptional regulator
MAKVTDSDVGRKSTHGKRVYNSTRRAEQAAETRRRIVEAAGACFSTQGYGRTTLAQIAERAGVSPESVAANGPKRALLIAAFSQMFTGAETEEKLSDREPWRSALFARPDEVAERIADVVLPGQAMGIGIWRALSAAAIEDDEVATMYAALARRRRADNLAATQVLADRGLLRPDRTVEQHADMFAFINGFDPYQLYVLDFGWTTEQLRDWYVDTVRRSILAPVREQ